MYKLKAREEEIKDQNCIQNHAKHPVQEPLSRKEKPKPETTT